MKFEAVQFRAVLSLDRLGRRETRGTIHQRSSSSLSAGGPCEQFWYGQGCPLMIKYKSSTTATTKMLHSPRHVKLYV